MVSITCIAEYVSALIGLGGAFFGIFAFIQNNKRQDNEIVKIKAEQKVIVKCLEGVLDGLHQLGCNGKVTENMNMLHEHLNDVAHE